MSDSRLGQIKDCLRKINERNDTDPILEFGIFEGYSISEILKYTVDYNMPNKVFGFDSFQGLPKDEGVWGKGQFCSTLDNTLSNIKNVTDATALTLVEGFFVDSLTPELKSKFNKVSLIHVDSDLYESCCQVLNFCKDLIKPGTFILFDEWSGGESQSWGEFSSANNLKYSTLSHIEDQVCVEILPND
jgi:hypothetical protein